MIREIVLDTETTGTDPALGDRIIEIGCVELINHVPTGKTFHTYLNPERPVSEGAFKVHGLSDEFLADKPLFKDKADEFEAFIRDTKLVIHNAQFDIGFLNHELSRLNRPKISPDLVIDTLSLARKKHPGASNSLDALCARYAIDNTRRTLHGALLDSEILSEVYLELIGGKQIGLSFAQDARSTEAVSVSEIKTVTSLRTRKILPSRLTEEEKEKHQAFVEKLGASAIWKSYRSAG